jgi:hypothetical protein
MKAILFLLFAMTGRIAAAGVATTYDEMNLVTYRSGDDIVGYYRAHNEVFSCSFLFMANARVGMKEDGETNVLRMQTFNFTPHKNTFAYAQRDPRAEITGTLYLFDNEIAIKTDRPHGGCQSAAGLFNAAPGERGASQYSAAKRFNAIGISISTRKTYFYDRPGAGKRRQYILAGDLVTLLSRRNDYLYARYVNPDMGIDETDPRKVVYGWLRSGDLMNPFPTSPASELRRSKKNTEEK